jgi:hypothetical protein
MTLETGSGDRVANMHAFAAAALKLLADCLAAARSQEAEVRSQKPPGG